MTPRRTRAPAPPIPPLAERQRPPLSQTLPGPFHPLRCAGCRKLQPYHGEGTSWTRWVECDPMEQPTAVVLVFCKACQVTVMEPHPRLYRALEPHAPHPGAMRVCLTCTHRDGAQGLQCASPLQLSRGGAGMRIRHPAGSPCHLNFGGGRGAFIRMYPGPPTGCSGYEGPDDDARLAPTEPTPEPVRSA